jgi:hypothetical protein
MVISINQFLKQFHLISNVRIVSQGWSLVSTKENRTAAEVKMFAPRWGHSMVVFNGNIIVFGGAGNDAKATNDIALINGRKFPALFILSPQNQSKELQAEPNIW